MFYSIIIPVFRRPDHARQVLECLCKQTFKNFEVIIVENESPVLAQEVVNEFKNLLDLHYYIKENEGQGFSRNLGMSNAKGDFFIILDSDILLPENYVEIVDKFLEKNKLDAYGGPDKLHPSSSIIQKAVNYCMTAFLTTGGTRGGKKQVGQYFPRSFNMGVSRTVYEKIGGYKIPFMGEDLEWSHRIINAGFKTGLIPDAHVFHERKGTVQGFYNQINFFGRARINIMQLIPGSFKVTHLLPIIFCVYVFSVPIGFFFLPENFGLAYSAPLLTYCSAILIDATTKYGNLKVGLWSVFLTFALMLAYCTGMIREYHNLYILKNEQSYKV